MVLFLELQYDEERLSPIRKRSPMWLHGPCCYVTAVSAPPPKGTCSKQHRFALGLCLRRETHDNVEAGSQLACARASDGREGNH